MGFRIPTIVASPWSRGGWVNSQIFDHTSTLMFLEDFVQKKYGKTVKEENISAWRRAISGDLTSCFRPHDANEPKLDYLDRDKFVVSIQQARFKEVPANFKALTSAEIEAINHNLPHAESMPHQEPGIRPACALPYELYAEGGLSADGSTFQLHMKAGNEIHGSRSAGAPFNVYLRNTKGEPKMISASYAVKAGDTLHEEFPLALFAEGRYSIDVHGPNGFYRSFSGGAAASGLHVKTSYERRGAQATGNMQVVLGNTGAGVLKVTVKDNSYKTGSVSKTIAATHAGVITLPLDKSHGWYDFTVQAEGSDAEARFAGRVETGRPSFSDPLMGGLV
jgi:phospholipase C